MSQMSSSNKKEDRGFFTQLPIVLFDQYADKMPATSFVAFMKFYRHFGYKGIFKGSIRKLCNALGMAIGSVYRAIGDWVKLGLVRKGEQKKIDENRDEMVLLIEGNDLWKKNIEHSRQFQGCSKLEQSAPAEASDVPENKGSVPNWNNSVPDRDKSVPELNDFVPTSSTKSPPYITEDSNKITEEREEENNASPNESHPDASLSLSPENHSAEELSDTRLPTDQHTSTRLPIVSQNGGTAGAEQQSSESRGYMKSRSEPPDNDAPTVPNLGTNALLARLTKEQSTFWLRFCKIAEVNASKLNQRAFQHVCALADKGYDDQALKSHYDFEYKRLRAAYGPDATRPSLGNLVNSFHDWKATQRPKEELSQGKTGFVSGSGSRLNHTIAGTWKDAPPVDYSYVMSAKPVRTRTATRTSGTISPLDFALQRQQFAERVGVPI
jgi:hypothetical protein